MRQLLIQVPHRQGMAALDKERSLAMQRLRHTTREYDIFWWVDTFLNAGQAAQHDHSLRLDNGGWTPQMRQLLQAQKKTPEII
jgi:hypothetical protein